MSAEKIRQLFLDFFKEKGHTIVPSSSLIPDDPSVLLTTAGMQQFKPYYIGEKSPYGDNVASVQKCFRTSDIDSVGDESHLTFFEMLGNFSFGGYFKEDAIKYAYEFITSKDWMNLKIDYVSVFGGDEEILEDKESEKIWKEIDGNLEIRKAGKEDNFWGPTGEEGPCGPTTEIYVKGVEIWNIVFNEYYRNKEGKFTKLEKPGVDTGMGLERLAMVVQKVPTIFETDLFKKLIELLSDMPLRSERIIVDHIKAAIFLLAEGVEPSNAERGYVLRRLIRRAVRYGKQLDIKDVLISKIAQAVIEIYREIYPELQQKKNFIEKQLTKEEEKFSQTIREGLKKAEKILNKKTPIAPEKFRQIMQIPNKREIIAQVLSDLRENKDSGAHLKFPVTITLKEIGQATITAKEAFDLYQSFGFHQDMMLELAQENNLFVDRFGFRQELKKHQELSRTASAGMFKSGLADHSEQSTKYHTATHLLLAALRQILGDHVFQKGSNITIERLRFDFSHPEKLTLGQIKQVEDLVNQKIQEDLPVKMEEISLEEAKKQGAMGVFEAKYSEKVKVYTIGDFSKEICGGPHVQRTGELDHFRIVKEEASSAGVRRIKAVLD